MIVVMQQHCSDEDIEHILVFLKNHGLSGHLSRGTELTVIGVLGAVGPSGTRTTAGGINPSIGEALEGLPGVAFFRSPSPTNWPAGNFIPRILPSRSRSPASPLVSSTSAAMVLL